MATLLEIFSLVHGAPELQQRFRAARTEAAWDILNEDPGTTGHTERLAWANGILDDDSTDLVEQYARFLSNATIQASGNSSTDNDILFVVASWINTWAGVT